MVAVLCVVLYLSYCTNSPIEKWPEGRGSSRSRGIVAEAAGNKKPSLLRRAEVTSGVIIAGAPAVCSLPCFTMRFHTWGRNTTSTFFTDSPSPSKNARIVSSSNCPALIFIHRMNDSVSLRENVPLPDSASAKELRQYEVNPNVLLSISHSVT